MRLSALALLLLFVGPARLAGQTPQDFSQLKAKAGDIVYVTDLTTGVEVSGPLSDVSDLRLAIDGYVFAPAASLKIERRGDPIWDGAVYGFLLGALVSGTTGAEGCLNEPKAHCVLKDGLSFAALGALIDWMHKGRTTVYDSTPSAEHRTSMRFVPWISTHDKGSSPYFSCCVVGRAAPGAALPASRSFQFMIALKPSM
jgi:hypothetical protein